MKWVAISSSLQTTSPFSTSIILSSKLFVLFEKNRSQNSQNFLEDAPCGISFWKYSFLTFLNFLWNFIISGLFEILALFFKADLFMIAFRKWLLIKDLWFPRITFMSGISSKARIYGVSNQTSLMIISNIKCKLRNHSYGKTENSQQNTIQEAVLKNFAIFTGKHLRWSFFLIKLQLQTPTQVFSYEYSEILRNTYFEEDLWTAASNYGDLDNFVEKIYLAEDPTTPSRVNLLF